MSGVRIQAQSRIFPNLPCNCALVPKPRTVPTPANTILLSTPENLAQGSRTNHRLGSQPWGREQPGAALFPGSPQPAAASLASFRETQRGAGISYHHTASLSPHYALLSCSKLGSHPSFKEFQRLGPPIRTAQRTNASLSHLSVQRPVPCQWRNPGSLVSLETMLSLQAGRQGQGITHLACLGPGPA